jgi:alpha-tubulin suppressor-like RCC1 family protein
MKIVKIILFTLLMQNSISQTCWQKIACGNGSSLGIKSDGSLFYSGGSNQTTSPNIFTQLGNDMDWNDIFGGSGGFSFAKKNNGTLWAWGFNNSGQLGNGTTSTAESYIPIQAGIDTDWKTISTGTIHVIGLKLNNSLWSWGNNQYGQLGDGTSGNIQTIPIQIGTDTNWQIVSAGGYHTLAIKNDGTLWTWGRNNYGQLGDGTLIDKSVPTQIGTNTNWQSISASTSNSLALKTDGTLWAWGYNNAGQVGNGINNFTPISIPTQVGTDTDWGKIATARWCCYAIKQNGKLYHFGANGSAQGGNGTTTPSAITTPTQVGNDANWSSVYSNLEYAMSLKSNGNLYSWGYNVTGSLAIGSFISQYSPVLVSTCNLATAQFANTTVTVYPNPTAATLTIANTTQPIIKLVVTDMLGKKILEQNGNATQINVSELQKGLYVLQVYSDGEVSNYKFVRE